MRDDDLVLLDPFDEFLPAKAPAVVPQMAEAARRAAVLLFALNRTPGNEEGQRDDELLEQHLLGAWRMTCPPLPWIGVRGESTYHAEVVLAAHSLFRAAPRGAAALRKRLVQYLEHLARVLGLPASRLAPRAVGR